MEIIQWNDTSKYSNGKRLRVTLLSKYMITCSMLFSFTLLKGNAKIEHRPDNDHNRYQYLPHHHHPNTPTPTTIPHHNNHLPSPTRARAMAWLLCEYRNNSATFICIWISMSKFARLMGFDVHGHHSGSSMIFLTYVCDYDYVCCVWYWVCVGRKHSYCNN